MRLNTTWVRHNEEPSKCRREVFPHGFRGLPALVGVLSRGSQRDDDQLDERSGEGPRAPVP